MLVRWGQEEEEPATACAHQLASKRSMPQGCFIKVVHPFCRNTCCQLALLLPALVQQRANLLEVSLFLKSLQCLPSESVNGLQLVDCLALLILSTLLLACFSEVRLNPLKPSNMCFPEQANSLWVIKILNIPSGSRSQLHQPKSSMGCHDLVLHTNRFSQQVLFYMNCLFG